MMLFKASPVDSKPKEGDRKTTIHFAWWPKKVREGTIFLERYERHYQYRTRLRVHLLVHSFIHAELPAWDIIEEKRITACA